MDRKVTESDFRMPEFRDAKPEDYEFRADARDEEMLIAQYIDEYGQHPDEKCATCNVAHWDHHEHGCFDGQFRRGEPCTNR